jgi:uncharacterized protein (TIGR00251 family)
MMEGNKRVYLSIKVKARARESRVEKTGPSEYRISVVSPPSKGKANQEVVKALASYFDLPPSQIKIISGIKSPRKRVLIEAHEQLVSGYEQDKEPG